MAHTKAWLEARAKARWEAAKMAFEEQNHAEGWVHLLAMGCDLAACEPTKFREPLSYIDVERVARDGGLIP